jgi:hypothetical protein
MRSLLVATVIGKKSVLERMAAPKTLEPDETPRCVRGIMRSSTVFKIDEMRVGG